MKLKNILAALLLLLLASACSMEEDILNQGPSGTGYPATGDQEAFIALNLGFNRLTTKATSFGPSGTDDKIDQEINNLWAFLLENDQIVGSVYVSKEELKLGSASADGFMPVSKLNGSSVGFLTKVKEGLSVALLANTSYNNTSVDIAACKALADIKALELNITDAPKFAVTTINKTDLKGYDKILGDDGAMKNPSNVNVTLKQLYARVALTSFVVKKAAGTKDVNVKLTSATLINQMTKAFVTGESSNPANKVYITNGNYNCNTSSLGENGTDLLSNATLPSFPTFPNATTEDGDYTAVSLSFQVGVNTYNKVYNIKTPSDTETPRVEAGKIYQLAVTMTVTAKEADIEVVCYTEDWKDGGNVSATLKPNRN